jgi:hypothetical protein
MKYILLIVLGTMALGLSACSLDEANSKQDVTNVPASNVDFTKPRILAMPDDFSNIAYKCDQAGNMVYMTSSKRIFVMPSKTCTPPPPIVHSDR